jgi:hypothetical protein
MDLALSFLPSTGAHPTVPDISSNDDAYSTKTDEAG